MNRFLPLFFIALLLSCSGDSDAVEEDVDLNEAFEELTEEVLGPVWSVRSDGNFFEIELPTVMKEWDGLNPDASLQYGFAEDLDTAKHENFIIVVVEDFGEEKMDSVDHIGFTEAYLDSLMRGRQFEVENEPAVEQINEMDAIIHELKSTLTAANDKQVELYYMMGVFKGQRALYQVLSWTLYDQKELFRNDMRHMMYSFHELGVDHVGHDHDHHNH